MSGDGTIVKQGATYSVQDVRSAIYTKRPTDALYLKSNYFDLFPTNAVTRGQLGVNLTLPPSDRIYDLSEVLLICSVRIFSSLTGQPLADNTKVRIFHLRSMFTYSCIRLYLLFSLNSAGRSTRFCLRYLNPSKRAL